MKLKPFIPKDLSKSTTAIPFQPAEGWCGYRYRVELFSRFARFISMHVLQDYQFHPKYTSPNMQKYSMRGLATVGIIALVDETTGCQRIRTERALAAILEKFIAKELPTVDTHFPV